MAGKARLLTLDEARAYCGGVDPRKVVPPRRFGRAVRHLHDAKGTFVTRLVTETDLTDQEIASLVDWSVANVQSIKHRYVSGAAVSQALLKRFRRT